MIASRTIVIHETNIRRTIIQEEEDMNKKRLIISTLVLLIMVQMLPVSIMPGWRHMIREVYAKDASNWRFNNNFITNMKLYHTDNDVAFLGGYANPYLSEDIFIGCKSSGDDRREADWEFGALFDQNTLPSYLRELGKMGQLQFQIKINVWSDMNDDTYIRIYEDDNELRETHYESTIDDSGENFDYQSSWFYFNPSNQYKLYVKAVNSARNYSQISDLKLEFQDLGRPGAQYVSVSDGHYKLGDTIDIRVHYDETVIVDSDATIPIGGINQEARYYSGSGTKDIIYRYTVQLDDLIRNDMSVSGPNKATQLYVIGLQNHLASHTKDIWDNQLNPNDWVSNYNSSYTYDGGGSFYNDLDSGKNTVELDGVPPEITSIRTQVIPAEGRTSEKYLNSGDRVLITLTTDDIVLGTGGYIDLNSGGRAFYKSGSGTREVTYEYTVGPGENAKSLYYNNFLSNLGITDDFGNYAVMQNGNAPTKASHNGEEICIDTTKPTAYFTPNGNSIYKKSHSATIQAVEAHSGVEGDLLDYLWTASRVFPEDSLWLSSSKLLLSEGLTSYDTVTGDWFLHVRMRDNSGNVSEPITSEAYKLDNQKPDISITPNGIDTYLGVYKMTAVATVTDMHAGTDNSTVEYQWQYTDEELSIANWRPFTNGERVPVVREEEDIRHGRYTLHVRGKDILGNPSQTYSQAFYLDRLAPEVKISEDDNMDGKRKQLVMISADDEHSDMKRMAYYWSKSAAPEVVDSSKWVDAGYKVNIDGEKEYIYLVDSKDWPEKMDGLWHLHVLAEDEWGNTIRTSKVFKVDNAPPIITFHYPLAITDAVREASIKVDVTDYNGISSTQYQWTKTMTPPESSDSLWQNFEPGDTIKKGNETGQWYLHIKASDGLKNATTITSKMIRLDNAAPDTSNYYINAPEQTNNRDVSVEIRADDFERVNYYIKDKEDILVKSGTMDAATIHVLLTLPDAEGAYTYGFSFEDELSQMSPTVEKTFIYDKTAPEATLRYSLTDATREDVLVTLDNIVDNYSQQDQINMPKGNTYTFKDNGNYTFQMIDQAGNEKQLTARVDWIDKLAPSVHIIPLSKESSTKSSEDKSGIQPQGITPPEDSEAKSLIVAGKLLQAKVKVSDNRSAYEDIVVAYIWSKETTKPESNDSRWLELAGGDTITQESNEDGGWYLYIKAIDQVGNEAIVSSQAFITDQSAPAGIITYSTEEPTANAVVAKLAFEETGVRIIKPESGANYHTFTENGNYTFEYEDAMGNLGTARAEVNHIDPSLPKVDVVYSETDFTKENVEVIITRPTSTEGYYLDDFIFSANMGEVLKTSETVAEDDPSLQSVTYEIEQNGRIQLTLKHTDEAIEDQPVVIDVPNIDKEKPTGKIQYSTDKWTSGAVTAKLIVDDVSPVTITNNEGSNQMNFTENGTFEFTFQDAVGHVGTATAVVSNIDKESPTATCVYSETEKTNQPVEVTITPVDNSGEEVMILNNSGKLNYTFTENGSFTFRLRDQAGNESDYTVEVDYIDTSEPGGYVTYDKTGRTKDDVVATVHFNDILLEPVTITNNGGQEDYTFTENGIFDYEYRDSAGNTGRIRATVDWMDKVAPKAIVQPSTVKPTNQNVVLSLVTEVDAIVTNNEGMKTITASENGTYTFHVADPVGNVTVISYEVTNIDRVAPIPSVYYSAKKLTNLDVVATVSADEAIKVLNNYGSRDYVFTRNGEYTFDIADEAGNTATITATVGNIDKIPPQITVNYSTKELTNKPVEVRIEGNEDIVILNNQGSPSFSFKVNGYFGFVVEDVAGNRVRANARVQNIDFTPPTIQFDKEHLLYLPNETPVYDDYLAYDDQDGVITDKVQVDLSAVDMASEGEYTIRYSVTDRAGNEKVANRPIKVLSPDEFLVYVNGEMSPASEYLIDASQAELSIFNAIELYRIKVKEDTHKLRSGDLKKNYDLIDGHNNSRKLIIEGNQIGWHTYHIQDQNRRTKTINIFFLRSE